MRTRLIDALRIEYHRCEMAGEWQRWSDIGNLLSRFRLHDERMDARLLRPIAV